MSRLADVPNDTTMGSARSVSLPATKRIAHGWRAPGLLVQGLLKLLGLLRLLGLLGLLITTLAHGSGKEGTGLIPACLVTDQATIAISIERALTRAQRQQGLMGRESLPEYQGMLFIYKETRPASHTFWMRNTLIPLDIAYIDSEGVITAINSMEPCTNRVMQCPTYAAGASFQFALEMNHGFFAAHDIGIGDRFTVPGQDHCPYVGQG